MKIFHLKHLFYRYKIEVTGKSLPVLTNLDKGRYGVIVFENFNKYLQMDNWNRQLLDKYCREYYVGIIGFITPEEETYVGSQMKGFPLFIHTNLKLKVGRFVFPEPAHEIFLISTMNSVFFLAGCRFECRLTNIAFNACW